MAYNGVDFHSVILPLCKGFLSVFGGPKFVKGKRRNLYLQ